MLTDDTHNGYNVAMAVQMHPLKRWLRLNDVTLEKFGERIGVGKSAVSKYILGQREPDISTAIKIEKETGGEVTVADMSCSSKAA